MPRTLRTFALFVSLTAALLGVPLSQAHAARPTAAPAAAFRDGRVLAAFEPGTSHDKRAAIEADADATEVDLIGAGTRVLEVPHGTVVSAIARLRAHSEVRYAEPDYTVYADATPNDPSFGQLWGLSNTGQNVNGAVGTAGDDINATPAWNITTGSASIVVGDVDTGIDYNHPDLKDNVWSNPGGINGCAAATHGYNAISGSCDPLDDNDHGSHTAGTIGATGNNGAGVTGVNWHTSIMGLKFLNQQGSGSTSGAISAIDWAVTAKLAGVNVRVLNNSWGGGGFSQALLDEIKKAGANDILFVAAAGNSSANVDASAFYPCAYNASNVICVAATTQNDGLASFSNYGANTVDLGAPGTNIYSTVRGGGYDYYNGTSMATPHVTGAAALVLSTGYQSVSALKTTLLGAVDPVSSLSGKTVTGGRLDVCKAIAACGGAPPPSPTAPGAPTLSASAGDATVHLSWTTPANGGSAITGYKIYKGTGSGGESLLTTVGPSPTSYDDNAVNNNITYYYKVSSVNSVGEGAQSNEASANPQAPPSGTVPAAPALSAGPANGKGVQLSWNTPSNGGSAITGYRIYRSTVSGGEAFFASVGVVTGYKDTSTARGGTYYYRVAAVNSVGEGPQSIEASAQAR